MKKASGLVPTIETSSRYARRECSLLLDNWTKITINLRSNAVELEGAARDVARGARSSRTISTKVFSLRPYFNNGNLNSMLRVVRSFGSKSTLRGLSPMPQKRSFGHPQPCIQSTTTPLCSKHRRSTTWVFALAGRNMCKTPILPWLWLSRLYGQARESLILLLWRVPLWRRDERLAFCRVLCADNRSLPGPRSTTSALTTCSRSEKVDRILEKNRL